MRPKFLFFSILTVVIIITMNTLLPTCRKTYSVGEVGPAGGYIIYDKGSYSQGWRYIEVAPHALEFQAPWGSSEHHVDGTRADIGYGKSNTLLIISEFDDIGIEDTAAHISKSIKYGNYDDWFLPSKDELSLIYRELKRKNLSSLSDGYYWSSTQENTYFAWQCRFSDGTLSYYGNYKHYPHYVRPVRVF
jgi:hypothetical protein